MKRGLQNHAFAGGIAIHGIRQDVGGSVPAGAGHTADTPGRADGCQKIHQLFSGNGIAEPAAGSQGAVPVRALPKEQLNGHGPGVLLAVRVSPFQHEAPFVALAVAGHAFHGERRPDADFLHLAVRLHVQLVQPGAFAFRHKKEALRHGAINILFPCRFHDRADSLKGTQTVQIVEVRRLAVMGRADSQLAIYSSRRSGSCFLAGIPRRSIGFDGFTVVVRAKHDFPIRIPGTGCAGYGFQITGIEGDQHGVPCSQIQACPCGVAFGNKQRAVLGVALRRNGEEAAGRFAALEKEFVRPLGGLVRQDELQALYLAGLIQNRDNKPSVLRLSQADGRDFLSLQIRMIVPGGSETVPDVRGQLCGCLPATILLGLCVGFGGGKALVQSLALGGAEFPFRLGRPCSLFAGAPVLPPDGGRSVQKRLVRAVLAMGPVRCAAAVQEAIGQNGLDLQPGCTQTLGKAVQNVGTHCGLQTSA